MKSFFSWALIIGIGVGLGLLAARFRVLDKPSVFVGVIVLVVMLIFMGIREMAKPVDDLDEVICL